MGEKEYKFILSALEVFKIMKKWEQRITLNLNQIRIQINDNKNILEKNI